MSPVTELPQATTYQSYLVRMWRSGPDVLWRASAKHTQTGETVFFASLESLFRFLHNQSIEHQPPSRRSDP